MQESEKRRATSDGPAAQTSIAEVQDFDLIPGREPFSSDLVAFDAYLDQMKATERLDQDPPFNQAFWTHVRSLLEAATSSGFETDDYTVGSSGNIFRTKAKSDLDAVIKKIRVFDHIMPCSPNLLAEDTGIPLSAILCELFYATRVGLTEMLWIPECIRCGGSVCHNGLLENIPKEAYCSGCVALTKSDYLDQIKTVFVFTSSVFYAPMIRIQSFPLMFFDIPIMHGFAMAAPTASKRIGFRYLFDSDAVDGQKGLAKGKYRVLDACTGVVFMLNVEQDASADSEPSLLEVRASSIVKPELGQQVMSFTIPSGKLTLDLIADTASVFMPFIADYLPDEDQFTVPKEYRVPYLSASECIHHPSFPKLFPNQIVSQNTFFKIQRVVFVFTDVVGSTALYESAGDGPALDIVQTHFKVLFTSLSSKGRVVKTVGDAVMAAFTSGRDAIMAVATALRMLPEECKLPDGTTLSIRVGIHSGPAVVVPLNGINDYFGSTVNQSARVEGKAESSECLVTEAVFEEPSAKAIYEEVTSNDFVQTRDVKLALKGVIKPVRCRGMLAVVAVVAVVVP